MKKQINLNYILLFFILFCVLFLLSGCSSQNNSLASKTEDEIDYIEEKIVAMANSLNGINFSNAVLITENRNQNTKATENSNSSSQQGEESSNETDSNSSDSSSNSQSNEESTSQVTTKYEIKDNSILIKQNENIDWEYIKSNTETMHSAWSNLTIDLHELNVNNEEILNSGNILDQLTLNAKEENKVETLSNLAQLYDYLSNYRRQISKDNEKINIDYTKACIVNSYALMEQDKWDEAKKQVTDAINYFSNVINSINENTENQSKISKIYVMLNELNNSISLKDKDLYMIKYRNVMEKLVNL